MQQLRHARHLRLQKRLTVRSISDQVHQHTLYPLIYFTALQLPKSSSSLLFEISGLQERGLESAGGEHPTGEMLRLVLTRAG
jgi:hypothetical protein